jgi:uncharacterized protein with GYD domain
MTAAVPKTAALTDRSRSETIPAFHDQEEIALPKYLFRASYTADGAKGLISEGGSGRVDAAARVAEGLGGKLESYYFAFGEDDVVGILDLPDNVSMAAVNLTISATGLVNTKTTVLLTPEEVDEAARKSVSYRGPGD